MASSAPAFRALPLAGRVYIGAGILLAPAAAAGAQTALDQPRLDFAALVVFAILAGGANLFEVFAPGNFSFQLNLVFFLAAAAILPAWAIPVVAVASFLPGWVANRFRWYMVAFNIANYTLAGIAAFVVLRLGGGGLTGEVGIDLDRVSVGLVGAAVSLVLVNLVLLAGVVVLANERPLREVIPDLVPSVPLDLSLALTGAAVAVLWTTHHPLALLVAGPLLLIYRALWVPLLEHKSRTDGKTGLFNAEHLVLLLQRSLTIAGETEKPLSVVMFDLDHLREINNAHGHLVGDEVIISVAQAITEEAPQSSAGRFGGDEFCLILEGCDEEAAREVADRICACAMNRRVGPDVSVSLSAGVATCGARGDTVDSLLRRADAALYRAKAGGRRTVRVAARPPVPTTPAPGASAARSLTARVLGQHASNGNGHGASVVADQAPRPEPGATPTRQVVPYFAVTLVAAAAGLLLGSDSARVLDEPVLLCLLVAAALLLDLARVDLFERANMSPASVPTLVLAFAFGPAGPILSEFVLALSKARATPRLKLAFDFGALSLSGAAAAATFQLLGGPGPPLAVIAQGVAAGAVYYVVNILLLAGVMALSEGRSPAAVWRERLAWLWPQYLFFGALAAGILLTVDSLGPAALAIFVGPIALLWFSEQQYVSRSRKTVVELRQSNDQLREKAGENQQLVQELRQANVSTVTSLARTIEAKDPYTGGHTERVSGLTSLLAAEFGFSDDDMEAVGIGGIVHDIGKIGIADAILLKPGPLTDEEFAEMRRHPEISSYILAELSLPPIVLAMARHHHERWDGRGYPDRLAGEDIPLAARLLTVADALDAMTSDRPYRSALSSGDALDEIRAQTGQQFCPHVVEALMALHARDATLGGLFARERVLP